MKNAHTDIFTAISTGRIGKAREILRTAPSLATMVFQGKQPMHEAARYNRASMCELLIELGADVNARDEWGNTPLHIAVDSVSTKCVRKLIAIGAQVSTFNILYYTPLEYALCKCSDESDNIAAILIKAGCEVDLVSAAMLGNVSQALALLSDKPDALASHPRRTELLPMAIISAGMRGGGASALLQTLSIAICPADYATIVHQLVSFGADPNWLSPMGYLPLNLAVEIGAAGDDIVRILLEGGANPRIADESGQSGVRVAKEFHNDVAFQLMMSYVEDGDKYNS